MPIQEAKDVFSPREAEEFAWMKESERNQMNYGLEMRKLDLELEKVQAKWSALLRLPALILKLPLLILMGVAYIIHVITGREPSDNFWNLLK